MIQSIPDEIIIKNLGDMLIVTNKRFSKMKRNTCCVDVYYFSEFQTSMTLPKLLYERNLKCLGKLRRVIFSFRKLFSFDTCYIEFNQLELRINEENLPIEKKKSEEFDKILTVFNR